MLAIREMPGSSEGFDVLDEVLVREEIATRCALGDALCTIMPAQRLCDFVVRLLKEDPLMFLNHENPSEITKRRRAIVESQLTMNRTSP